MSEFSYQFPHVAGWRLGRVDPPSLLSLGHSPSQCVVFLQDGLLGLRAQLSEDRLAGAGGGGSLVVNIKARKRRICHHGKYIYVYKPGHQ